MILHQQLISLLLLRRMSAAAVALIAATATSSASDYNASASATVLEAIQIIESENLAFGSIVPPSTGLRFYKVDEVTNGTSISGGGTGGAFISGHHRGRYQINGTAGYGYDLVLTSGGACTTTNIALQGIAAINTGLLDDADVYIGGTLRVNSVVTPGAYTCPYTLTATYN